MTTISIKRILVPVDFSETSNTAVGNAITLAKAFKAEIFLLHVFDYEGLDIATLGLFRTISSSSDELETAAQKKITELKKRIEKKGIFHNDVKVVYKYSEYFI